MLKAILFDIDNTLLSFDGYVKESMKRGFEKFGICTYKDEMYDAFTEVNSKLWIDIENGELQFEDFKKVRWNKVFERIGVCFDGVKFEEYFREGLFSSGILELGAIEILEYLKDKYILCTASNGPFKQQKNRLRVSGILPYFSHLFISEEIGYSKPAKEFFNTCMKRLNDDQREKIHPCEVMIVGDSLTSDMAGGIVSGIKTCFYNPGKKDVDEKIKTDYVISSLKELENIL